MIDHRAGGRLSLFQAPIKSGLIEAIAEGIVESILYSV